MTFKAELLRKRLKDEGKTRKFLAQATGKTERTVSRWLNGENPPKGKDLDKIAKALSCRPQDFDPSYADEGLGVAMYARVSAASHNAYEMMRLRYGVTQKGIIELAPVLFSIVASYALKVPSDDDMLHAEAVRRGLHSSRWSSADDADGFAYDERASANWKCFGLPANDPATARPRNLFYEAISRLSLDISDHVDTTYFRSPEPGEAPVAAGFIPDVDMIGALTGGDATLIEALAKGRIRLSTCWEAYQKSGCDTLEGFPGVLQRELAREDEEHLTKLAAEREASLAKLKAWRAFYGGRHADLASEYDQIVEAYCHEEGWSPEWYDDDLKDACWADPYQEDRFINDDLLPEYQRQQAQGIFAFPYNDPVQRRFRELQAHRNTLKAEFEEFNK